MDIYLGIDFGAENIYVSYKKAGEPAVELLTNIENGHDYLKNYLAIDKKGKEYFGLEAWDMYGEEEMIFYSKYKKYLAKPPEEWPQIFQKLSPPKVMIKVLKHLRQKIFQRFKEFIQNEPINIKSCVVTVPVGWQFNNTTKEVYRMALNEAGFENFRLVDEPTAAAANVIMVANNILSKDKKPKKGQKIMVIDIGASTIDINVCAYEEPITAYEGTSRFYAGNYIDIELLSSIAQIDKTTIESNLANYIDVFAKIQSLKHEKWRRLKRALENKEFILGKEAKVSHFEEVAKNYADMLAKLISDEVREGKFKGFKIDFLVICGGMSEYAHADFRQELYGKIEKLCPENFAECCFMNKDNEMSANLLQRTIANGAAMLAENPDLVLQRLNVDIYVIIIFTDTGTSKTYPLPVLIVPKGTPIGGKIKRFSALKAMKKIEKCKGIESLCAYEVLKGRALQVSTDVVDNIDTISFSPLKGPRLVKDKRKDDLIGYLDGNGIVNFEIIDKKNGDKIISQAKFSNYHKIYAEL